MKSSTQGFTLMKDKTTKVLYILLLIITQSACGKTYSNLILDTNATSNHLEIKNNFLPSGSITLSFPIDPDSLAMSVSPASKPAETRSSQNKHVTSGKLRYAPIVGFLPPIANFNPADNEVWIEIDRESTELNVFKGKEKIKSVKGEGSVDLAPGEYPLQHKQKEALWYASDEYFLKRHLKVPPKGDNFRYRRGALGSYSIYPTMEFIIHSGPFWSEEVGGMKVSESELASIYLMIQVGTPIVVK
jgi:hypothetical protein